MQQARVVSLLAVLLVIAYQKASAAPIGAIGALTVPNVRVKHKPLHQQNSLDQPGISSEYGAASTSGSSNLDNISTGARGSALSASISPDGAATQDFYDSADTQNWYGDHCFEVKEEDVCLQEIVRRDCSRYNNGVDDITDMWT